MTTTLENVEALVRDLSATDAVTQPTPLESAINADLTTTKPEPTAKPRGYLHRSTEQAPWPPVGVSGPGLQPPKPLPKRPTGRFFVGSLLATICITIVWFVWTTFLGVAAYGVVKGDTLTIGSPWDGKIAEMHVREGQTIGKGDVLATLDSTELLRRMDRLQDELRVEEAKLGADIIRIRQDAQTHTAEYFEVWATLQKNREELSRMQRDLERIQSIKDQTVIPAQERDRMTFAVSGQRELVEKMTGALDELRKRADVGVVPDEQASATQLKPTHARIEYLRGEIRRTHDEMDDGVLRSPVSGVVVRRHAAVGQYVSRLETLVEVIDRESLQVELFVPQDDVGDLKPGMEISVSIESLSRPVTCTVVGSRERFEEAPDSIQRFYKSRETLMPLILKPHSDATERALHVGAVTRLTLLESFGWY